MNKINTRMIWVLKRLPCRAGEIPKNYRSQLRPAETGGFAICVATGDTYTWELTQQGRDAISKAEGLNE